VPRFEDARIGAAEQVLLPQCLAEVRKRDDDALPRAHKRVQLVLGLREAACDERRALRLEGELLPGGKRVEERGSFEGDRVEPFLGPDCAHLVGQPHEVRPCGYGRYQVFRNRDRRIVVQLRLHEVEPPLGGGIDQRRLDRVECALRERRERAHLLDLVAPELDPERLTARRREDVDEPAADGELAALVGTLHALVAGQRERLRQLFQAQLLAGSHTDGCRTGLGRRHRLGERGGRCGDQASGRQHVERASPLADEMGRRIQP
jgi:hypothetical protein